MNKKTLYGKEAREKMLGGVKKICSAIKPTLGPMGRNIAISQSVVVDYGTHSLPLHITKDGVTVANSFDIEDPFEKPGVLLVKEACRKTVDECGDGTTTCAVLLEAIATEGIKLIEEGANPMELKRGIDEAVEYVIEELKKMATPIKGDVEKIRQIATVSANNDSSIGDLIAEAFKKIGDDGIIDIEASKTTNTEIKIADGFKFDRGWISPLFVSNREKQICEFTDPFILLYDKKVTHHTQVQKALEISMQQGKPILIICDDADEEGLAFLAMNNIQKRIQCCVVKAPEFGELRNEYMEDIATLTGGTYVSDRKGVDVKQIDQKNFGQAKKVVISKDETIIIGGKSNKNDLKNLLNELRMNLAQAKTEEDKFPIEKRIARLTGGIAVIHVGASTETEMKEKLDRFDDAVRATKSAISEGFVLGGGTAFIRIIKKYGEERGNKSSKNIGIPLLMQLLYNPLAQICKNAGISPDDIIADVNNSEINFGYNAKTNKIENLLKSGIIDPVKVLRCSLKNAASAAGMLLTCEAEICDTF